MMRRFFNSLVLLSLSFTAMAAQFVPAISDKEDIARQGVMDGYNFGPFKMLNMTTIVDSVIRKPKMTKPLHFSEAEMNALSPKNIAEAIEIIRPPRSNSHGSANLKYRIQTPPERTQMSPSFDIRYVSEMKEEGLLGIGWTIDKFILHKEGTAEEPEFVWNYKKYSNKNESCAGCGRVVPETDEESDKIVIKEGGVLYTFVPTSEPELYQLDNSAYRGDSIIYYYNKDSKKIRRNYIKIDSIDCKYSDDLIPHVKVKFGYENDDLIKTIDIHTLKEKYDFTKENVRTPIDSRYELFSTYTFDKERAVIDNSKKLLKSIEQKFESYDDASFSHTFQYYNDTALIDQLDEMAMIYLDSIYTDNIDSVKTVIDSFRLDRTDMLKVAHTPLGACYTVNYGREIVQDTLLKDSLRNDTILVMKYLKINDGYHTDGPLALNRYSYKGFNVQNIDPINKNSKKTDKDDKSIVVRFDTVFTYNMSVDDAILNKMMRIYDTIGGSKYDSESSRPTEEVLFNGNTPKLVKVFTYQCDAEAFGICNVVDGEKDLNKIVSYSKDENSIDYMYIMEGSVIFLEASYDEEADSVLFAISEDGKYVYKEVLKYNDKDHTSATFKRYKNDTEYISYELTYDKYGNMIKCVMPKNDDKSKGSLTYLYEYDRRFNQYQTGVVDSRGFTSHMEDYDYTIGQPKTIRDINGYVKKYTYRLNSVLDTVISPIEIDMANNGDLKNVYSALTHYNGVKTHMDMETIGVDRKDTMTMKVDIPVKDSVQKALFSDVVKQNLYSLLGEDVDLEACKLTFEKDSLKFSDTLGLAECFCLDTILIPSSISLKRFDQTNGGSKMSNSLYVDGLGRKIYDKVANSAGDSTIYDDSWYDELAQKTVMLKPYVKDPQLSDSIDYVAPVYDQFGRITKVEYLDKYGILNTQNFEYDLVGRVTKYNDNYSKLSLEYDLLGNLVSIKDELKNTTTSFAYDNAGNMISKKTPAGDVISYVYEFDNLKEVKYPRIPSANVTNIYGNKNSSYGRRNRVALSFNSSIVDEYFYNQQGSVAKVRRTMIVPNGKILTYVTEFKYDTWGRLIEMIYPDGEILTYAFNIVGLPESVKGSKTFDYAYVDKVDYDYLDRMTAVVFNNGVTKEISYEDHILKYATNGVEGESSNMSKVNSSIGEIAEGLDENSGKVVVSNDGYLSTYFYDMSGNLAMNIGASNEKIYVNGKISGVSSRIEESHLIVNKYFEDQDSLRVKHILLNDEMVMTKAVDSFSYGARPVRIERAGSNTDEIGFVVNYDSLHKLTANKAIQERVAVVGDEFYVDYKPFIHPLLRSANVDNGEDNEETDIYVYGVDENGDFVNLLDKDKMSVLKIEDGQMLRTEDLRFIPLIRSNEYMKDISNGVDIPMLELNNESHQIRDAFGR